MRTEYKDKTIEFDDEREIFVYKEGGDEIYSHASMKEVKKFIDKIVKGEFKRIPVYVSARWNRIEWEEAEITSITPNGEVWVTTKGRTWRKVSRSEIALKTEDNKKVIEKIAKMHKEAEKLEEDIRKTANSITMTSVEELKKVCSKGEK